MPTVVPALLAPPRVPVVVLALALGAVSTLSATQNEKAGTASEYRRVVSLGDTATIRVGANVLVSTMHPERPRWEVLLSADPTDPRRMIACAITGAPRVNVRPPLIADTGAVRRGRLAYSPTELYQSTDSGRTWTRRTTQPGGDPICSYAPNGDAYFGTPSGTMQIQRSRDGGSTWDVVDTLPVSDRPFVAVDPPGGQCGGELLLTGLEAETDSLSTFAYRANSPRATKVSAFMPPPIHVRDSTPGIHWAAQSSDVALMRSGRVVHLFLQRIPRSSSSEILIDTLKVALTEDCGRGERQLVTIVGMRDGWRATLLRGVMSVPRLAVDLTRGAYEDRLYAVWADIGRRPTEFAESNVVMSVSSDSGETWSDRVVVNKPHPAGTDALADDFLPVVAVNRNGVVGVLWSSRVDFNRDRGWTVKFAASYDGGLTFTEPVLVSEGETSLRITGSRRVPLHGGGEVVGYHLRFDSNGGDTNGLVALPDGSFQALWVDARTRISQMWTARIEVAGQAVENGDASLANLLDVSETVELRMDNAVFDQATRTIEVDLWLINRGYKTLHRPFAARVVALDSELGTLRIVNASAERRGPGTIWDFMPVGGTDSLPPGASTEVRRVWFRFADIDESGLQSPGRAIHDFMTLRTRRYAGGDPASSTSSGDRWP